MKTLRKFHFYDLNSPDVTCREMNPLKWSGVIAYSIVGNWKKLGTLNYQFKKVYWTIDRAYQNFCQLILTAYVTKTIHGWKICTICTQSYHSDYKMSLHSILESNGGPIRNDKISLGKSHFLVLLFFQGMSWKNLGIIFPLKLSGNPACSKESMFCIQFELSLTASEEFSVYPCCYYALSLKDRLGNAAVDFWSSLTLSSGRATISELE